MAICLKCIIPDCFPNVEMKDGICKFCRINDERFGDHTKHNREKELEALLNHNTQSKYDCLVPLSGGKDSTYILYYLVKKLQLKPLAFFFDNGYCTEYAKNNVSEICKRLNTDLIIKHATKYRRKLVHEAWKVSYYSGKIFDFCGNCENNHRSNAINEALHHGIRYVIWGSTDYEGNASVLLSASAVRFRDSFSGRKRRRLKYISFIKSMAHLFLREKLPFRSKALTLFHRLKYMHYYAMDNIKNKAPEGFNRYSPFLEVSFDNKKTETVYFYDYIPYDPIHQIKVLEQEVGWKGPVGREVKMDCKLHHIGNVEHYKRTGITDTGFKLAVLVRNGMISREEAIRKEKNEIEFLKTHFKSENLEIPAVLQNTRNTIFNTD